MKGGAWALGVGCSNGGRDWGIGCGGVGMEVGAGALGVGCRNEGRGLGIGGGV